MKNNFNLGLYNINQVHEVGVNEARVGVSRLDGVTTCPLYRATPEAKGITNPITGETYDGYQTLNRHVGIVNTKSGEITMTAEFLGQGECLIDCPEVTE